MASGTATRVNEKVERIATFPKNIDSQDPNNGELGGGPGAIGDKPSKVQMEFNSHPDTQDPDKRFSIGAKWEGDKEHRVLYLDSQTMKAVARWAAKELAISEIDKRADSIFARD